MRALTSASLILGLGLCLTLPSGLLAAPPEQGKVHAGKGAVVKGPIGKGSGGGPKFNAGPKFNQAPSGKIQTYKGPSNKFHTYKGPSGKVQTYKGPSNKFQTFQGPSGKFKTFGKGQAFPQKYPVVYRSWHRKRYYGRVFAGVVIGTILLASAYYAYSAPPDPELCWYWADPYRTRGYWDFCDAPPPDWY